LTADGFSLASVSPFFSPLSAFYFTPLSVIILAFMAGAKQPTANDAVCSEINLIPAHFLPGNGVMATHELAVIPIMRLFLRQEIGLQCHTQKNSYKFRIFYSFCIPTSKQNKHHALSSFRTKCWQ